MVDLQRARDRIPGLDAVLRVADRYGAIGGGPLTASIALASFLSLFPLLLVAIAVVGFWSSSDAGFAARFVHDLGLRGGAADTARQAIEAAEGTRQGATTVGLLGLLWTGLGVVGAMQAALNAAWQAKGRGLVDRLVAIRWLAGAGLLFLVTASLGPALRVLPGPALAPTVLVGMLLTTALFVWTYGSLGTSNVPWRAHLPGAVLVAVGFELLKAVGSIYVPHLVASASGLYGSLGLVFAVLAWLLIFSRLIVYGAVLNVLRYEAAEGTTTVEIEVPHIDGEVPLTATRGGAVDEQAQPTAD